MHLDIMQSSFCLQSALLQPNLVIFSFFFSEKDGEETNEEKEAQEAFILACEHIRFSSLEEEMNVFADYVYPDQDDASGNRQ